MTKAKNGGGLRDRIKARGLPREGREIEVPEWEDTVWVFEPTVAEAQRMASLSQEVEGEGEAAVARNLGLVVDMLLQRLKDEDGDPVFSSDDREWLMDHPLSMISRLATQALAAQSDDTEEDAKND